MEVSHVNEGFPVIPLNNEMDKKYYDYICEHIRNVRKAYQRYGGILHKVFPEASAHDMRVRVWIHDQSKFSISEFQAYRQFFYPTEDELNIDHDKCVASFDEAWKHHYTNNDHHQEHWSKTNGMMCENAIFEMVLDWLAMSMYFNTDCREWFDASDEKAEMNPHVLEKVERAFSALGM